MVTKEKSAKSDLYLSVRQTFMASASERRTETRSTQLSDYQDAVNEGDGSYEDELATLYDDTNEEDLSSILPVSAPSQASFFDDYPESIRQDYEESEDFDNNRLYTNADTYSDNYNYERPSLYNFYSSQIRTVPPFYDSTTHRDTYTWKYVLPDRYQSDFYDEQYGLRSELPEFQDETTHRETYQNFEFLPPSRESGYSSFGNVAGQELPRFDGRTTHRDSYTPKTIQKSTRSLNPQNQGTSQSRSKFEGLTTNQRDYVKKTSNLTKPIPPPRDNLRVGRGRSATPTKSTNRADYVELKQSCPAEKALRSGIKNSKHRNGHFYFVIRNRRHESAPAKLKSRRSKSSRSASKSDM